MLNLNQVLPKLVEESLNELSDEIVELQKDQLYSGLDADGKLLKISYYEDPYFKSQTAADKYARFKSKNYARNHNDAFPEKPYDIPDLVVNGRLFYNFIKSYSSNGKLIIEANSPIYSQLEAKYGDIMGLSDIAIKEFRDNSLRRLMKIKINSYLNGM